MSTADYSPAEGEHSPLALGASSEPSQRPSEPSTSVEGLTVAEAATAFGLSVSTIRRLLKEGKVAGAAKVPGPKGSEYRLPPGALEALGYKVKATLGGAMLTTAQASLEAETLAAKVAGLEASLELERVRRQAAEDKAEALAANLEDLRAALAKLPAALEAPKRRRWLGNK